MGVVGTEQGMKLEECSLGFHVELAGRGQIKRLGVARGHLKCQ